MQVLFRQYDGKYYVWKEAKHNGKRFVVDERSYNETDIIAAKSDDGGKFVVCKYCGEQINNTPEAIEKHFVEQEAKRDCLACRRMSIASRSDNKRVITKNAEGKYDVTETYTAHLQCNESWSDPDSETGKRFCMYNRHRIMGVEAVGGVLMQYPDLFEKQMTVETLKAKGCTFMRRYHNHFMYDMFLRNTLFAHVNECGIVDYFEASYRYDTHYFYYSATQKKLFYANNGCYTEGKPDGWSDNKYNMVRRKIEAFYKEDKAK